MSENKFIQHLKGENTAGSLVEVKNQSTPASFGNMPQGTSEPQVKYADVRGDVTVVANGTMNWKISNSNLVPASVVSGDGQDFTSTYSVSGAGLWVNATYTFPSTGDANHPVAMIFNPNSKWVLKLCGDNLVVDNGSTVDLTLVITFGTTTIISKQFTVAEQANQFCKELVIDFAESNANMIKASGLSTMKVQVLCGTANASARIYNGMTVFTVLQRKVDAAVVSGSFANVEEVMRDGLLPNDYFSNAAYIAQIEDGDTAYAVFQRDGDEVALAGWAQPIPDQTNNAGKFLTTDGAEMSWAQLTISDVDNLSTELSDLQDQIDSLSGRGRFLALWNCATGLAESNPPESPYPYKAGDYFVVGTVSSADPAVNYKPDGSSYTTGVASTTIETNEVSVNDTYFYDGTVWKLQSNAQKEVSFSALAGSPYDNTNLASALNDKVTKNTDITGATKCKITYDSKGLVTSGADLEATDIPSLTLSKISDVTATASEVNVLDGITASTAELNVLDGITASTTELNYTDGVTSNIQTQLDGKQDTLTAGTNITIDANNVISSTAQESFFRGNWNTWDSVPTEATLYPADYKGNKTPTNGDFLILKDASGYVDDFPIEASIVTYGGGGWATYFHITIDGETKSIQAPGTFTYSNGVVITAGGSTWGGRIIQINRNFKIGSTIYPKDTNYDLKGNITSMKIASENPTVYQGSWRFAYNGVWSSVGKNGWKPQYQIENVLPIADDQTLGIAKLYTTTGNNTDGAVDQATITTQLSGKQETLVSGTNIKTINNNSLLGSGDITIDSLPSQTGQSGKFLTTDGTDASWATVDALPSQTGQSGKFLTTNGTTASWGDVSQMTATYDLTTEKITFA